MQRHIYFVQKKRTASGKETLVLFENKRLKHFSAYLMRRNPRELQSTNNVKTKNTGLEAIHIPLLAHGSQPS